MSRISNIIPLRKSVTQRPNRSAKPSKRFLKTEPSLNGWSVGLAAECWLSAILMMTNLARKCQHSQQLRRFAAAVISR